MKRLLWLSLLVGALLIAGAAVALAQDDATPAPTQGAPDTALPAPDVRPGFVDADGDGVCDNCGQGMGNPNAPRLNFVDADGDGICDNMGANGGQGRQMGRGAGRGFRGGRGG